MALVLVVVVFLVVVVRGVVVVPEQAPSLMLLRRVPRLRGEPDGITPVHPRVHDVDGAVAPRPRARVPTTYVVCNIVVAAAVALDEAREGAGAQGSQEQKDLAEKAETVLVGADRNQKIGDKMKVIDQDEDGIVDDVDVCVDLVLVLNFYVKYFLIYFLN